MPQLQQLFCRWLKQDHLYCYLATQDISACQCWPSPGPPEVLCGGAGWSAPCLQTQDQPAAAQLRPEKNTAENSSTPTWEQNCLPTRVFQVTSTTCWPPAGGLQLQHTANVWRYIFTFEKRFSVLLFVELLVLHVSVWNTQTSYLTRCF